MPRFIEELNRRAVFRVGAACGVIAWIIARVAEQPTNEERLVDVSIF